MTRQPPFDRLGRVRAPACTRTDRRPQHCGHRATIERLNRNDVQSSDRTFLAWLRTGVTLFGLGFVVARLASLTGTEPRGSAERDLATVLGVLIVLGGAAIVLVGLRRYRRVVRSIARAGELEPRWPGTLWVVTTVGALLLSVLIVVSG